jgi:hypothetical protein
VRRLSLTLLLPSLVLAGCQASAEGDASTAVRDSAGITIVENRMPDGPSPAGFRLSESPGLRIGQLDGAPEYQFHRIQGIVRLSDGAIVVADGGSTEIRFFAPDGEFRSSTGGRGDGPGEFQLPSYMRRLGGDTLLVFDNRHRRVTLIAPAGEFVRDFTPAGEGESAPLNVVGALEDGTLLARVPLRLGSEAGSGTSFRRDTANFVVRRPGGAPVPLAPVPGSESRLTTQTSGGNLVSVQIMRIPFARAAFSTSGRDRFHAGSNETYEVKRYGPDGTLETIVRSDHVPLRPSTPELVQRFADEQIVQREAAGVPSDPASNAALREMYGELPLVPALPTFASMLADDAGRLWIQEFALPGGAGETDRWMLFDAEGRAEGIVEMPAGFRPHHIDEEVVVGVAQDDFDVEYVHIYRLEPR